MHGQLNVKLTTDLNLVPKSKMTGALPLFYNTSPWRELGKFHLIQCHTVFSKYACRLII